MISKCRSCQPGFYHDNFQRIQEPEAIKIAKETGRKKLEKEALIKLVEAVDKVCK